MGIEQLLATLGTIEAVSKDTIAAIRKAFEGATKEAEAWKGRADKAEAAVSRLNDLLGGSDKDAKTALENLKQQVTDLTTERDKYKGEAETLKSEIKRGQKLEQLGAIATKAGIDRDGLAAMIKSGVLPEDKTVVEGEGDKATIKIDGKEIKEYLKAYPYLERALIVSTSDGSNGQGGDQNNQTSQPPQNNNTSANAPTGGTNGTNANKNPVLGAIVDLGFAVPGTSDRGNN